MKLIKVSMLVLALSVYAYAGNMDNGKTAPPPPAPSTITLGGTGTAGHMGTPVAPTDDAATLAVLNLLQSVLALL